MIRLLRRLALPVFALVAAFAAAPAMAAPINYTLTLTATVGGINGTGSFSIDGNDYTNGVQEIFTPGDANKTLLTLSFAIDGIVFDLAEATFAQVLFQSGTPTNEHVTGITYQGADGGNFLIFMNVGALSYVYSNSVANHYSIGLITVTPGAATSPVPEPMTLALLGAGLVGLGIARRRKAA